MENTAPETYTRRILLAVSGMSPQVLTETLWALTQDRSPAFAPTEIHLITTTTGARNALLSLLDPKHGQYLKLCRDYEFPEECFTEANIHILTASDGSLMKDIRTPAENEAAADFITEMIRQFTDDESAALHVSMAGGRKTMGYYAGYALSLFGRVQDRLSHVLVSSPYEGLPNFFFPSRESELIRTAHGVLDARDAEVTLAEIPFVRLRNEVPEALLAGKAGFSETIQKAQRISLPVHLTVDLRRKLLVASGQEVVLTPLEFAFYAWIIHRQLEGVSNPCVLDMMEPNKEFATELVALLEQIEGEMGRDIDRTRSSLKRGMERGFFDEKKSRVNKQISSQLGKSLSQNYQITGSGKRGRSHYTVALEAEQIDWIK